MDRRHRVYYFVNLNQNHNISGWWARGYDSYGVVYNRNLSRLKKAIPSLKIMPSGLTYKSPRYYQMKVSCKYADEQALLDILNHTRLVDYEKIKED